MNNEIILTFAHAVEQVKENLPLSVGFIVLLFVIQVVNWMVGYRLNILGIWPRKLFGLLGIPFSPFLHGSLSHFMFNALPLFIFSCLILMQGPHVFYTSSMIIIFISGLLTWSFARSGVHVGASGLIMGYLGFILLGIYYKPSPLSLVVGIVCLYYFGGMLTSLFPSQNKRISFEGHLFGFAAGILAAYCV